MQVETMLFFPNTVKFCAAVHTNKNVLHLAKDKQRTTYLSPIISFTLHEIGSPARCRMDFMGYGGDYRLTPDLGYYPHCLRSLSQYINQLVVGTAPPLWNITNTQCPIHDLPKTYLDYISCDLVANKWYELNYDSSIRYETYHNNNYRQFWANHSTVFLFKPEYYMERNGTEVDWLEKLVHLDVRLKNCERVRYLLTVDSDWPLPVTVYVDYQVSEGQYIKYKKHMGNGTLDRWFSGSFSINRSDRTHELCVQLYWRGSKNRFQLCRTFLHPGGCDFSAASNHRASFLLTLILMLIWMKQIGLDSEK
uniref:Uncharacterized protein n=1 Tax=Acrobeloides nanus TaxID=290746 RepID=A0A914CE47_9BILA